MVFAATGSGLVRFLRRQPARRQPVRRTASLALDARTGKRVWHFQGIRHDVWDWDFPAAPNLVTVRRNGRLVEAVAQVTKFGYVYVLDRQTARRCFRSRTARCRRRRSTARSWPSRQPYPLKPPPFTRQGLTEAMLTTRTPEAHAAVLARFQAIRIRHVRAADRARRSSCSRLRRRRRMGRRRVRSATARCSTSTRTRCRGSCG